MTKDQFRIELVWNREFNWCVFDYANTLESAKAKAISIRDSGDGARVKKVRVLDNSTDKILWNG